VGDRPGGELQNRGIQTLLYANQIQLNLCKTVLTRPQIQRRSIDLIDDRRGKTNPRKINSLKVVFARVTSFNANMVKVPGMKISKLGWPFLTAVRTDYPAKLP